MPQSARRIPPRRPRDPIGNAHHPRCTTRPDLAPPSRQRVRQSPSAAGSGNRLAPFEPCRLGGSSGRPNRSHRHPVSTCSVPTGSASQRNPARSAPPHVQAASRSPAKHATNARATDSDSATIGFAQPNACHIRAETSACSRAGAAWLAQFDPSRIARKRSAGRAPCPGNCAARTETTLVDTI